MISFQANNEVMSYDMLGFNKRMQKQPDGDSQGVHSSGYVDNIQFDSQFESVDIGKLNSNQFRQIMDVGKIKLDGVKGSIEVRDDHNKIVGLIGNS